MLIVAWSLSAKDSCANTGEYGMNLPGWCYRRAAPQSAHHIFTKHGTYANIWSTMSGFEKLRIKYCQDTTAIKLVCAASRALLMIRK